MPIFKKISSASDNSLSSSLFSLGGGFLLSTAMLSGLILGTQAFAIDPLPDNTRANQRDARGMTITPMDQSNEKGDLETTARIRREILGSDKFSRYADNIKIITTADRKVTLRGPVQSSAEVSGILAIAKKNAPDREIINELEISPK